MAHDGFASWRNGWGCRGAVVAMLCFGAASPGRAGAMATTPELRQAAVAACTGDVLRLCPTVIFDEQRVFACMRASRSQLTPNCRAVFDQGAKTVKR